MEPEGSLLCSQDLTKGSYPDPDESNPHPPSVFPLKFILFLSSHPHNEWEGI
jgi:hypothetical protein